MGKIYELTMTRDYVSGWGVQEAMREIIQNAMDNGGGMDVSMEPDYGGLVKVRVRSEGGRLPIRSLLLGATTKAQDDSKIGSFGEGYKLAMLVLLRCGKGVYINNADQVWTPRFQASENFAGEEVLCIGVVEAAQDIGAVEFVVEALTEEEAEAVKGIALPLQAPDPEAIQTSMGTILPGHPGKLFVGGLFVCKTNTKNGYDILPRHLKLERDRNAVSSFDLKWATKQMWFETGRTEQVAEMIADNSPDMEYAEYGAPEIVKEEVFKIFQRLHPGKLIASSMEDMRKKIESGISKERIVYVGDTFGTVASQSAGYKGQVEVADWSKTPHERLEDFFREHRGNMRTKAIVAFKSLMKQSSRWKLD